MAEHDVLHSLVLLVSPDLITVPFAHDACNKIHLKVKESNTDFAEGTFSKH